MVAPVLVEGALWPLLYLPPLIGVAVSALLLGLAMHPGLLRWRPWRTGRAAARGGAGMTLHLYLARRFFMSFLGVAVSIAVLLMMIGLMDKLGDFPDRPFGDVLAVVLLDMPWETYDILPLFVILASVALFVRLSRSRNWWWCAPPAGRRCTGCWGRSAWRC